MENYNILSTLLTLPLAGAVLAWFMPKATQRLYAIFGSIVVLALSIYVVVQAGGEAIDLRLPWLPEIGTSIALRLDAVSKWFVLLNALVGVVAFSLRGPWYRKHPRLFTSFGFFLIFALNAAFLSTDLIVFYLAYEAVFIPMIFMVGIWGHHTKAASVFRFFLMSFLGSVLMLVSMFSLIYLYKEQSGQYSSNVADLMQVSNGVNAASFRWCFLGFFLAFAIKVPVFPFHGWLKEVYVNAPMPATIWLSAILSKLGVFGFIRFVNPLFMEVAKQYQGLLIALAAISILYAAFLALKSDDPKTLLAYSSISHLGFVMLGVFSLSEDAATAAVLLSVGHTLVSAMLFYILHLLEERKENLGLESNHGLARTYPTLFTVLFIAVLASVSLPGTLNFAGEFLVLIHAYPVSWLGTVMGGLGVILGAVYMLKFFQQLGFGKVARSAATSMGQESKDLAGYDLIVMVAMAAMLIYFGFQPLLFLKGN